jgi:hypothetical protein
MSDDHKLLEKAEINYAAEAFKWQYNVIALAGVVAFSILSASGLPLILGAGAELMYLSLLPQSSRFRRLVRSWKYVEEKQQRERILQAMLANLPPDVCKRYAALQQMCTAIMGNYHLLSSTSQMFVEQTERRLSGLLKAYVRLLASYQAHREYLRHVSPIEIKREIETLQQRLDHDPESVQAINRKRIEILTKRLVKFDKSQENGKVIDAQCAAIEDVLELIRDQSVNLRDPQQVTDQLDSLVKDVEHTEETVREVEAIFELAAPDNDLAPPIPLRTDQRIRS